MSPIWLVVLVLGGGPTVGTASASGGASTTVVGEAREGDSLDGAVAGALLFRVQLTREATGTHERLTSVNADASGRELSRQTVELEGGIPVSYTMSNPGLQKEAQVTAQGDELKLEVREKGERRVGQVPRALPFAVGPTVGLLIEQHLQELLAGQEVPFTMVVPERLDAYRMKLVPLDGSTPPDPTSRAPLRVAVKSASRLIGVFIPRMEARVDRKTGHLLRFLGPLPRANGDLVRTGTIAYDIAPP